MENTDYIFNFLLTVFMVIIIVISIGSIIFDEKKYGNVAPCDRPAGHGISLKEKELCILQDISFSLKK